MIQDQLRELIRKHCATLTARIGALGAVLADLPQADRNATTVLHEARKIAHQITGASGSMGFRDIGSRAQTLERYLEELEVAGGMPPRSTVERVLKLFAELEQTVTAATPESSTLYNADLSHVTNSPRAAGDR